MFLRTHANAVIGASGITSAVDQSGINRETVSGHLR
jgi:hypothetical protein